MALTTLQKIVYENLTQFVEDINNSFALIQNSPLYKGIPGAPGVEGATGPNGTRGSNFIFVNFTKFKTAYPTLVSGKEVNLAYINSKLTFELQPLLFETLNVTEFVDKDMIVLTTSKIIQYDDALSQFIDTGIAFNEQTNLISNIESEISTLIHAYVDNLYGNIDKPTFKSYLTNSVVHDNQSGSGLLTTKNILVPVFPEDLPNDNLDILENHNFYGFDNTEILAKQSSFVIGNIIEFKNLLIATAQNFNTNYSINSENVPALAVVQDNWKNGIMIGCRLMDNTKNFASIYKSDESGQPLVIKSHMGEVANDNSIMKFFMDRFTYDKSGFITGNLNIEGITTLNGNIANSMINVTPNTLKFGVNNELASVEFLNNIVKYTNFASKVLVTNAQGLLRKDISVETMLDMSDDYWDITNDSKNLKLANSYHIQYLRHYSYSIDSNLSNNYWTKTHFASTSETPPISSLNLGSALKMKGVETIDGDRNIKGNSLRLNSILDGYIIDNPDYLSTSRAFILRNYSVYGATMNDTHTNRVQLELSMGGINIPATANYMKNGSLLNFSDLAGVIDARDSQIENVYATNRQSTNLNQTLTSGLYYFNGSATGIPTSSFAGYGLLNVSNQGDSTSQTISMYSSTGIGLRKFSRFKSYEDSEFNVWTEEPISFWALQRLAFPTKSHATFENFVRVAEDLSTSYDLRTLGALIISTYSNNVNPGINIDHKYLGKSGSTIYGHPITHSLDYTLQLNFLYQEGAGTRYYIGIYTIVSSNKVIKWETVFAVGTSTVVSPWINITGKDLVGESLTLSNGDVSISESFNYKKGGNLLDISDLSSVNETVTNLNSATLTGFYSFSTSASNKPLASISGYGNLIVSTKNNTTNTTTFNLLSISQFAIIYSGSKMQMFIRNKNYNSSTFTAWLEITTTANIRDIAFPNTTNATFENHVRKTIDLGTSTDISAASFDSILTTALSNGTISDLKTPHFFRGYAGTKPTGHAITHNQPYTLNLYFLQYLPNGGNDKYEYIMEYTVKNDDNIMETYKTKLYYIPSATTTIDNWQAVSNKTNNLFFGSIEPESFSAGDIFIKTK